MLTYHVDSSIGCSKYRRCFRLIFAGYRNLFPG